MPGMKVFLDELRHSLILKYFADLISELWVFGSDKP